MRRHSAWKRTMVGGVVVFLAFGGTATAADVIGFNLVGPQVTKSSSDGSSITTTGSGSFDTAGTVVAGGSFSVRDANGSVTAHGSWAATGFTHFDSYGGPNSGHEGGKLLITVTLFPQGGSPQAGLPMDITCEIFAPVITFEGVTVGKFDTPEFGHTLFHQNN
jgi:hypothetical protein